MNVKKARNHLLTNGFVYSIRPKKRRVGKEPLFWEKFEKRGEVDVMFVGEVCTEEHLKEFSIHSGVPWNEWLAHWKKGNIYLYRIDLIRLL